ncbi:TetR/AcrR family transcriptional regulator [Arthrobacter sp. zg-Y40]|uniref:TetR/AcrR family transcriptional regulator n=1 Tax=unclassified Arthrobacter TaxID=235627 RepID=UPI001D15C6A7|nr:MULTISPECIES: TetR family transcriptional regulator [unclassified Arthrobacter]MCC3279087.1 TetR/AcrR family transcriptional regulator [Arthrobacter sp. zg-Y40]MDK1327960.1 TetR family transcriptional regulator [Arthrobacter sp. zg-Y1143]
MPRLTDSRRAARREQIAAAAMRCFIANGFSETSMAEIIKESGLSAGSIYSHYDSKADLMRSVAAELLEERTAGLGAAATPGDVVRTILASIDRERARLLLQVWAEAARDPETASMVQDQLRAIQSAAEASLLDWVRAHTTPAEQDVGEAATAAAHAVLSAAQGYVVRIALDPGLDPGVLISSIAAMVDR